MKFRWQELLWNVLTSFKIKITSSTSTCKYSVVHLNGHSFLKIERFFLKRGECVWLSKSEFDFLYKTGLSALANRLKNLEIWLFIVSCRFSEYFVSFKICEFTITEKIRENLRRKSKIRNGMQDDNTFWS